MSEDAARPDRFTDIPTPDRFFLQVDLVEIEMRPMDHDDIRFTTQNVPGGKFGFEIAASYEYAGYDCKQHVCLDREGAEALYDALGEALGKDGDQR
jgi:hypothetical protein